MKLMLELLLYAVFYSVFNVAGAAVIKNKLLSYKMASLYDFIYFIVDVKIVAAFVLIFISMFFSIKALSISSFSSIIPLMTATNFMITILVGVLFFKDQLVMTDYIGIAFILVGVFLIGRTYAS